MKYFFLFALSIIVVHNGYTQKPFVNYFDNGTISEKGYLSKGKLSGEYSSYYENGITKVIATYINGSLIQKNKYDFKGNISQSVYMLNGSDKFQVFNYNEEGLTISKGFFNSQGLKTDEWLFYNSDNKIYKTLTYKNDIPINTH